MCLKLYLFIYFILNNLRQIKGFMCILFGNSSSIYIKIDQNINLAGSVTVYDTSYNTKELTQN